MGRLGFLLGLRILITLLPSISSLIQPRPWSLKSNDVPLASLSRARTKLSKETGLPSSTMYKKSCSNSRITKNINNWTLQCSKDENSQGDSIVKGDGKKKRKSKQGVSLILLALSCLVAIILSESFYLPSFVHTIKKKSRIIWDPVFLRDNLVNRFGNYRNIDAKGAMFYSLLFIIWNMTMGVTVPFEIAAGRIFGIRTGLIINIVGKQASAILSFLIARHFCYDRVRREVIKRNNKNDKGDNVNSRYDMFEIVIENIKNYPLQASLMIRFSLLPEFLKNFALAVLPVSFKAFTLAMVLQGLPFSFLWTLVGAETKVVMRGMNPNKLLEASVIAARWLGK